MAENKQLGVVLLVVAAGLAFWQFGDRDSDDRHTVGDSISTVRLAAGSSDISITASDDDKTTVQEKRHFWFWKHGDAYSVKDGVLTLDGDCGWQCRADFEVTVPRGTKVVGDSGSGDLTLDGVAGVDAQARSGDVEVSNVSGDVKLDLTSGDASISDLNGKLELSARSGDLEARGLKGGPVTVETTSGKIELALDEANDVHAKGTSGDIEISAPGSGYKVSTETRSGDVDNGLGNDANGAHSIDARTVSGDVELQTS
jgi:hypothetical protein